MTGWEALLLWVVLVDGCFMYHMLYHIGWNKGHEEARRDSDKVG